MAPLKRLEISVTGLLNGESFRGSGTLSLDSRTGTKSGTLTYQSAPARLRSNADTTPYMTGRGHIGAVYTDPSMKVGPMELLGGEFVSTRLSKIGHYGTISVSESAVVSRDRLRSWLTFVGDVRTPAIAGMGPLREVLTVGPDGILTGTGRYSLRTTGGRSIPVRYTHLYRSLRPNLRLFGRLRGRRFLLRARIVVKVRGRSLDYKSRTTIKRL
jgi:hypothetical protein